MSDTALKELREQVEGILNGREHFLGDLVVRFRKAAEKHPHDQAIRTMQLALQKKAAKESTVASLNQKQIQAMYDEVSNLGNRTHFQEELGDLLHEDRVTVVANYNEKHVGGLRDSGKEISLFDEEKVAELHGLWGDVRESEKKSLFIENGRRGIEIELESLGFSQPSVEVSAQDNNFVVYAAEIGTRRGRVPFLIPAEVKQGSVLMPSVFVSGDEFKDLNVQNIRAYLNNEVVLAKMATPKAVLSTLHRLYAEKGMELQKEASYDYSEITLDSPGLYMDLIGHDKEVQNPIDVEQPKVELPPALAKLADSVIKETLVESGLSYDRSLVLTAKQVVANELKLAKLAHDKVTVSSEFSGGIILATNIVGKGGKKRIEVPVSIANNQVLMPDSWTSGAMAGPFDEENLQAFANRVEGAEFDPMLNDKYDMSFDELHKLAMRKAAYGNFIEATEILSIINEKFGSEHHRLAHDDLMNLLKIGYGEEEKPLTAMEKFTQEAIAKAKDKDNQIKMSSNALLFYPKE